MSRFMMRSRARPLTLAVVACIAAACASTGRGPVEPPARIVFTNESLDQATVYVVAPGVEFRRIGTVIPGRTDTLRVRADMIARAGTVNIVARLLARSEVPQTGAVSLRPGEMYAVRLTPDARILSFLPAGQ